MSIPTAVFLDTTVFDGQSYNFSSSAFSHFVPACKKRNLKLLLPDPTWREVKRHMEAKSVEAMGFIDKARRTAPFLASLTDFPTRDIGKGHISQAAADAWRNFLKQFDVVRLNYDGISVSTVMNWYDAVEPPFGERREKRKEFPDAFAIAILALYAEQNGCYVAVVSDDSDMKEACARFSSLMHFHSLAVLTELLLSAEDSRIAAFRAVLETSDSIDKIAKAAYEATIGVVSFYYTGDYSDITDTEIQELTIADVRIVAVGEHDCTIAFDAVIRAIHAVEWSVPTGTVEWEPTGDNVTRNYDVSGTAKVLMDAKTNAVLSIPSVTLNEEEMEATDMPPFWDRW